MALQIKPNSISHSLCLLTETESWKLLHEKIFPNNSYPPALSEVGMQIAKSCKGLPLAVVIVAGILATMVPESWEKVVESISPSIFSGIDHCMELLDLSFKHLLDYLKPCLLYFVSFMQHQEVPVLRLIWLWIAKGFVQRNTQKSLENAAEDYLINLIGRSLVIVVKQRSKGGIKACRVHDLVHQFCLGKAKEENILQLLNGFEKIRSVIEPCRLCIYSKTKFFQIKAILQQFT